MRIHVSTEVERKFIVKQNECGVCFSSIHHTKVLVTEIPFFQKVYLAYL
jgi:hypothetical protein